MLCFNSSLLKYGGDLAVGAMTILSSVMQFTMLPLRGADPGRPAHHQLQFRRGEHGPRQKRRSSCRRSAAVVYAGVIWLLAEIHPSVFVGIFTGDPALAELSRWALRSIWALSCSWACRCPASRPSSPSATRRRSGFLAIFPQDTGFDPSDSSSSDAFGGQGVRCVSGRACG